MVGNLPQEGRATRTRVWLEAFDGAAVLDNIVKVGTWKLISGYQKQRHAHWLVLAVKWACRGKPSLDHM